MIIFREKSRKLYELNCSRDLKTEHLELLTKLFVKRDLCKRRKWGGGKNFPPKRTVEHVESNWQRGGIRRAWRNK